MKTGLIVLGVIAVIVVGIGGMVMSKYNALVTMDTDIKAKWAQVENQLQRRADLIPNLVETVKGFAAQEKSILEAIANARARMAGGGNMQEQMAASNDLTNALGRLLVVVENYPKLKSDATFIRLMDELAGTENRLAVERKRYNDSIQAYNTTIRMFPGSLIASAFGFRQYPFFQAPAEAKTAPQVKF